MVGVLLKSATFKFRSQTNDTSEVSSSECPNSKLNLVDRSKHIHSIYLPSYFCWINSNWWIDSLKGDKKSADLSEESHHSSDQMPEPLEKNRMRLDLVRKTVFRNFKKYFSDEFEKSFDFRKRRRNKTRWRQQIEDSAWDFLSPILNGDSVEESVSILLAMVDPKKKFGFNNTKFTDLSSRINTLLRGFNMEKAESLLQMRGFSLMMLHFLERPNLIDDIVGGSSCSQLKTVYQTVINRIKQQWYSHNNLDVW